MAVLTDEQKLFIVRRLAQYRTPSQVAAEVNETFGLDITRQQTWALQPHIAAGKRLRAEFERARKAYHENVDDIPIAMEAFRLNSLNEMMMEAKRKGNYPLAASLMEQAAKELGGAYTNRRELTGAGGGPIRTENLSEAEINDRLKALLGRD